MTMPAQEAAPTVAERRAARRANQTAFNLVIALLASLGIVILLVAVVVRPEVERPAVDYRAAAESAQGSFGVELAVPDLSDGWSANRAEATLSAADGVDRWDIGFLTPGDEYIELTQGVDTNTSWLADQVRGAQAGPAVTLGGLSWTVYDRRDVEDAGNVEYSLVAELEGSTVVLSGTAADAEFAELAESVAKGLS